mmetsp:Transcript_25763/g.61189  ORF Transcript_25763/g.61189 Transcript_25763/m.61189 type:complete len:215 (+) Transcript_25763:125-769(+)
MYIGTILLFLLAHMSTSGASGINSRCSSAAAAAACARNSSAESDGMLAPEFPLRICNTGAPVAGDRAISASSEPNGCVEGARAMGGSARGGRVRSRSMLPPWLRAPGSRGLLPSSIIMGPGESSEELRFLSVSIAIEDSDSPSRMRFIPGDGGSMPSRISGGGPLLSALGPSELDAGELMFSSPSAGLSCRGSSGSGSPSSCLTGASVGVAFGV